ncbi:MAG: response regulator, partial [Ferrovibrio sp.]
MKPELLRARLLLVEDHAPTAEIMHAILQAAGFSKIMHAASVSDATAMLEHRPFDLVLCDFQLGIATGLELVRMIRRLGGVGNVN